MSDFGAGLALIFAGAALGWTGFFSFVVAPMAFRDLDQGRADRFVRNAMRNGHPVLAGLAWIAAGGALIAGALAGAVVLALAGAMYLLARWTLAPREDKRPPPGGKRVLKTSRIVASGMTAFIMLLVLAGAVLAGLKI
jgi:hypothetical protein